MIQAARNKTTAAYYWFFIFEAQVNPRPALCCAGRVSIKNMKNRKEFTKDW